MPKVRQSGAERCQEVQDLRQEAEVIGKRYGGVVHVSGELLKEVLGTDSEIGGIEHDAQSDTYRFYIKKRLQCEDESVPATFLTRPFTLPLLREGLTAPQIAEDTDGQ